MNTNRQSSRPQWHWSESRQAYYYIDARTGQPVLEGGQRNPDPNQAYPLNPIQNRAGRSPQGNGASQPPPSQPSGSQFQSGSRRAAPNAQHYYAGQNDGTNVQAAQRSLASNVTSTSAANPWVQDQVDQYNLRRSRLEAWLKRKFGNYDFNIRVRLNIPFSIEIAQAN